MFNKGQNDDAAEASPLRIDQSQPIRSRNVSVIGPTLVFKGELSADEDLVIDGTIEGTIAHHRKNLTIGKQGRVTADIHATSVLIEGVLNGNIHCEGIVSLAKTATVTGNIDCAHLVVQDGANFNGKVKMSKATALKVATEPNESKQDIAKAKKLSA